MFSSPAPIRRLKCKTIMQGRLLEGVDGRRAAQHNCRRRNDEEVRGRSLFVNATGNCRRPVIQRSAEDPIRQNLTLTLLQMTKDRKFQCRKV